MTLDEARAVLGERVQSDGSLFDPVEYLSWGPREREALLDGRFGADELEAIAVVMRANAAPVTR